MTNEIEQTKREMYKELEHLKLTTRATAYSIAVAALEEPLEAHLEALRQSNQELQARNDRQCETMRAWDKQIRELETRLGEMTEERDAIQLRLHAVDHAYSEQQSRAGTLAQDSGDRASCATPDAKTTALLRAVEDIQLLVAEWAVGDHKARKVMRKIAGLVNGNDCYLAMLEFEKAQTCMHSFFAIGDGQMKCTFCGVGK